MRPANGNATEGAAPQAIVQRLLEVLTQAVTALSREDGGPVIIASENVPPRRFEFVHNAELRQGLEQAYTDGRLAHEEGDYALAVRASWGILEAIVADAREQKGASRM